MKMIYPDTPPMAYDHLRCITVPSGIGEFQWMMSKLINCREKLCVFGLDGAPRRLHQFVELHPNVEAFGYVGQDYTSIREFQKFHALYDWKTVQEKFGPGQPAMIACNPHLERGELLADWMPDLATTYTYPIITTREHRDEAMAALGQDPSKGFDPQGETLIAVSCASYRGADAWHTWHAEEWIKFLQKIQAANPQVRFVLLGGSWDDLTASIFDRDTGLNWAVNARGIPPVGRTNFGTAIEILRRCDGYIGFSSGLGHVAAHLCNTPVFMLWPEHELKLSRTWCDPALLASGKYTPSRWLEVEEVYAAASDWLSAHVL